MVECEFDGPYARAFARRVAPDLDVRIVGVDDGDAARRQRADQIGMFGRHLAYGAHELLVFPLRVVDHGDLVGCAIAAQFAVSPRWFIPSSTTAARCTSRSARSVSGSPTALLRLPSVARTWSRP